jgi:hypothetical protein
MAFLKTENMDRRTMNTHLIIVRQPCKKWEELVIGQSSRPECIESPCLRQFYQLSGCFYLRLSMRRFT